MPIHDAPLVVVAIAAAASAGLYGRRWTNRRYRGCERVDETAEMRSDGGPHPDSCLALLRAAAELAVSGQSAEVISNGILEAMQKYGPFHRITMTTVDSDRREIVVCAPADSSFPKCQAPLC